MSKNILRIVVLVFLIAPFSSLFSQEENPRYALAFHPFALMWGGIKCHFDVKVEERQWLSVMPTVYLFPGANSLGWDWDYYDYDYYYYDRQRYDVVDSKGFGLELNYKYYLNSKENFYLLGGLSNSFFRVEYSYRDYIPFRDEDNHPLYRYDDVVKTGSFDKLGAAVSFGVNTDMKRGFYVNFYTGVGYLHSFYNKNEIDPSVRDNYVYDFRYRGFYPALGFSLGVAW
jgi:hypothetical protein